MTMIEYNAALALIVIYLFVPYIPSTDCHKNDSDPDVTYKTIHIPTYIWNKALSAKFKESYDDPEYTPVTLVVPIMVSSEDEVETQDSEEDIIDEEVLTLDEATESVGTIETSETSIPIQSVVTEPSVAVQTASRPCSCNKGQCGCCTGILLQQWNQKGCANISFLPEEFVFDMKLIYNNDTVLRRKVSVSDPPPICFNPRRYPLVQVCARLYNIHVKNGNANVCVDLDADLAGFSVFSRSFDCFRLGQSGFKGGIKEKPIKPSGGVPATNLFGNNDDDDEDGGGLFGDDDDNDDGFFGGGDDDGDEPGGFFGGDGDGPLDGAGDLLDGFE